MRLRFITGLFLFATAAFAQSGGKGIVRPATDPQAFASEKKLALVIGINDYPEESGLSKLKWAVKDASDLSEELRRQGYYVDSLLNERVTKTAIRRHLTDMLKRLDPDAGTVVFAFSGHGGQVGKEQYLATYESSADDLDKSGASVAELRDLLEASGAPRKMMFLDACRNVTSPNAKDSTAPIEPMVGLSASKGLRLLVSTGPKTRSYEYDDIQHGVFTYYVIQGLKGDAARIDGLVTFGDLAGYVTRKVKERNPNQVPYTDGQSTGEFPFAGKYKAPPVTPVSVPATGLDLDMERYQAVKDAQDPKLLDEVAAGMQRSDLAGVLKLRAQALRSKLETPSVIPKTESLAALRKRADDLDAQKRYAEALPLYRQLSEARDAWGEYRLGRYYLGDRGLQKDDKARASLYRKSAESGESYGMNGLGVCYETGEGVTKDLNQAIVWYRKALELGNPKAMYNLGRLTERGVGVDQDVVAAAALYRRGAELGDGQSMWALAVCYEKGTGVTKSLDAAILWYRKASNAGDQDSQAALKRLGK